MTMKQAIFLVLDQYADWEGAYLASQLNQSFDWKVRLASVNSEANSLGGFKTLVDYQLEEIPQECDLLVLIGGNSWSLQNQYLKELIKGRLNDGTVVAAICGAVDYLAQNGLLNDYLHTGNSRLLWEDYLKYNNADNFVEQDAVIDRNLITANSTGTLDFTRLVLKRIDFWDDEQIDTTIDLYKDGYYSFIKEHESPFA